MPNKYRFVKRGPFEKDWSPIDKPEDDPVCAVMTTLNTNYLQYHVMDEDVHKRGQMRYFRETYYAED